MNKQKLIDIIEKMIQDKNFMINDKKGNEKQNYAWEYSRIDLQNVLACVRQLND